MTAVAWQMNVGTPSTVAPVPHLPDRLAVAIEASNLCRDSAPLVEHQSKIGYIWLTMIRSLRPKSLAVSQPCIKPSVRERSKAIAPPGHHHVLIAATVVIAHPVIGPRRRG